MLLLPFRFSPASAAVLLLLPAAPSVLAAKETCEGHRLQPSAIVFRLPDVGRQDFRVDARGAWKWRDATGKERTAGFVREGASDGAEADASLVTAAQDPQNPGRPAFHYRLGAQADGRKAKVMHTVHVAAFGTTHVSRFRIRIDPDATMAEANRLGDPRTENWLMFLQWWQHSPESPPISIGVAKGRSDVLEWGVRWGDDKKHDKPSQRATVASRPVEKGQWTDFAVVWRGGTDGRLDVFAPPPGCTDTLDPRHLVGRYRGPIGYTLQSTLKDRPEADRDPAGPNFQLRQMIGIYQGPHTEGRPSHGVTLSDVTVWRDDAVPEFSR